jgi:post-segregation antitoxin (ccd killing protein)
MEIVYLPMKKAKKKSVGRPKMRPEDRRQAIEVTLHSDTIEQARAIGGTVSRGIEMSVTEYWAGIQPAKAKREKKP